MPGQRRAVGLAQLVTVANYSRVKLSEPEADHSPCSCKVKNWWICTFTPPLYLYGDSQPSVWRLEAPDSAHGARTQLRCTDEYTSDLQKCVYGIRGHAVRRADVTEVAACVRSHWTVRVALYCRNIGTCAS